MQYCLNNTTTTSLKRHNNCCYDFEIPNLILERIKSNDTYKEMTFDIKDFDVLLDLDV